MEQVMGPGSSRVPVPSPDLIPTLTYLVIVARDRPQLFQLLNERWGHAVKVILDRRRTPRPPLPLPRYHGTLVRDTRLQRDGFMFVPMAAVRRVEGRT